MDDPLSTLFGILMIFVAVVVIVGLFICLGY